MRCAKLVFIYSAIVVFLCFSLIGALGAFGKLDISGWATAAAIIGPCLGIVSAAIGAQHIFNDPDAITELRAEHAESMREMNVQHADSIAERVRAAKERESQYLEIIAKKDAELCSEREIRIAAQDELSRPPKVGLLAEARRSMQTEAPNE